MHKKAGLNHEGPIAVWDCRQGVVLLCSYEDRVHTQGMETRENPTHCQQDGRLRNFKLRLNLKAKCSTLLKYSGKNFEVFTLKHRGF